MASCSRHCVRDKQTERTREQIARFIAAVDPRDTGGQARGHWLLGQIEAASGRHSTSLDTYEMALSLTESPMGDQHQLIANAALSAHGSRLEGAAQAAAAAAQLRAISPHMKYIELFRRGYLLLDIDRTRVQGEWYFPDTISSRNLAETYAGGLYTESGVARLRPAMAASLPKPGAADPAP